MNTPSTDPTGKSTDNIKLLSGEHLLQPGDRVGHCRVIDLIAAGGMANVYKVWHEQLEVVRAIKILKPGYTEESKGRLEMEAKISANLCHPNIVDIYYMGYWNTIPFIEMEFIDGPSLKELLESRTKLNIPLVLAVAHYLCIALRFAYNQDMTLYGKVYDRLIHRDLKPANILISSKGVVKLADFGIARPSEVSIHTVGSKIMGTFAYLSPEQLSGEKLDQRSDIYALGAVIYEMITGVKTFPQKLLADLVQKKSKGYYTPVGSMGIVIQKPLVDIIEKCLQLDKNKRYSDVADLDEALMAVFKRQTTKEYDEILQSFNSDPNTVTNSLPPALIKKIKPIYYIITGIILLALLFGISFKIINRHLLSRKAQSDSLTSTFTVSPPVETSGGALIKDDPIAPQTGKQKLKPAQPLSSETPRTERHAPAFESGLTAFKSGNFSGAIEYLTKAKTQTNDIKKTNTISVFLFESYIRLQQYDQALEIAENHPIETAQFYLLKGELYYHLKNTSHAIDAVNKALTFEQIEPSFISRLRLLKARTSEDFYNLKPNADNMKRMSDDWKVYLDCCCNEENQSRSCTEARETIARFSF
ncbi:MAG TPA: serine/threonine-protein kinase [Chitinispirillaceae bacterium]|nr:serine/threonine-protein kinase [Chitinispirillaceae bacterium]